MADDYARNALSQRAAFEATHPAVLAAARRFSEEPVLRVVDLGAADGVNSHGLIRALADERAGKPLIYALVDLPTNAWSVAADHLRQAFGDRADRPEVVVIPARGEAGRGVSDVGTGAHYASPEAHGEACRRAVEHDPPPATVISLAGIPLQQAPCLPSGSVHVAVTGTAMHWVADAGGLASTGSVFPGYADHTRRSRAASLARRRGAAVGAAARDARQRARARRPVHRRAPGLPRSVPGKDGALRGDHRRHEPGARRLAPRRAHRRRHRGRGRRSGVDADARRDPTAPFEASGGRVAGLELESAELFRLDNPYWHDDPAVFARAYVRSVTAWGAPLFLRAFAREGEGRAPGLLADFLGELEQRVADAPGRYRWDYIEALVICLKVDGSPPLMRSRLYTGF